MLKVLLHCTHTQVGFLGLEFFLSIVVPNISVAFAIVGSTVAMLIGFIIPGLVRARLCDSVCTRMFMALCVEAGALDMRACAALHGSVGMTFYLQRQP